MSPERSRVLVAQRVACEPAEAFARFTEEIGRWWRPNGLFQFRQGRTGTLSFEPGVGGRLIETYDDGSTFEIGVIRSWDPPDRLVLSWRQASFPADVATEVQVTFERAGAGQTRVVVEHHGWDTIPDRHAARHGLPLPTLQLRLAEWWRALLRSGFPTS